MSAFKSSENVLFKPLPWVMMTPLSVSNETFIDKDHLQDLDTLDNYLSLKSKSSQKDWKINQNSSKLDSNNSKQNFSPNSILSSSSKITFNIDQEENDDQSSCKTNDHLSIFSFNSKASHSTLSSSPNTTLKSLNKIEKVLTNLNQTSTTQEIKKKLHESKEFRKSFNSLFHHLTLLDQDNNIFNINDNNNTNKSLSKNVRFQTDSSNQINTKTTQKEIKPILKNLNKKTFKNLNASQLTLSSIISKDDYFYSYLIPKPPPPIFKECQSKVLKSVFEDDEDEENINIQTTKIFKGLLKWIKKKKIIESHKSHTPTNSIIKNRSAKLSSKISKISFLSK